jgi:hypothetical protein
MDLQVVLDCTPMDVGCIWRSRYLSAGTVELCRRGCGFLSRPKPGSTVGSQELSMEAEDLVCGGVSV